MLDRMHRLVCVAWTALVCVGTCSAQGESGIIPLSELPPPPAEIIELLDRANVRFVYGSKLRPASMPTDTGRRLDGITVFKLAYKFDHQSRLRNRSRRPTVEAKIRLRGEGLTCQHTVWFREAPAAATFWSDRLVLHELDHVAISSDPRLQTIFKSQVEDPPVVTQIDQPTYTSAVAAEVNRTAQEHVDSIYRNIVALVEIRYKELDRITDHGTRSGTATSSRFLKN
ncbi:hypothetical protein Poly24_21480 [Rosistilla carotiformis]|uniref:Secreted Zn-dependent protease n=1 Tax=Rosistilla carotiformis TaxID=2528017 RepID=A0A518JSB3_9BACT|nr:hypothetical protein [Rosistilla carotiformis]QDV68439.1 hypothetical protein Poly24_21480 [Rosistilla carotiformis]